MGIRGNERLKEARKRAGLKWTHFYTITELEGHFHTREVKMFIEERI